MSTLVLLVGTNPLPNYVVAKYLITKTDGKKFDRILLVHSKDTEYQADRLHKVLRDQLKQVSEPCPLGQSTVANDINKVMYSKLATLPENEDIHLNYTGGRKTMSVHVHAALTKLKNNQSNRPVTFSYLDSSNYILRYDDDEGHVEPKDPVSGKIGDLRNFVVLDFEDELLALHDYALQKRKDEVRDSAIAEWVYNLASKELDTDEPSFAIYSTWISEWKEACQKANNAKKKAKETVDKAEAEILTGQFKVFAAQQIKMDKPGFEQFATLLSTLLQTYFHLEAPQQIWGKLNKKSQDDLIKFLEAGWQEQVIFERLNQYLGSKEYLNPPMTFCGVNIKPVRSGYDMELDIVLMRGYELIIVSCTTIGHKPIKEGDTAKLKGKGFEVIHQVGQLGGDEARSILVTMGETDTITKVEGKLLGDNGPDKKLKVHILGRADLLKLTEKIKEKLELN